MLSNLACSVIDDPRNALLLRFKPRQSRRFAALSGSIFATARLGML